jgi:Ca2+-binding EF-hand superfamily protein
MFINTELADKYQEFFNFFSQEHNLILTIEQMQEILSEAQKLESKLSQHDVSSRSEQLVCDVCGSTDVIEAPHIGRNCNRCHPL